MRFDVDVVVHVHQSDGRVLDLLKEIDSKLETIMALIDDLKTAVAELNAATNECSARIDVLLARLASDSLTAAEKTEILGSIKAESDRLKTLAADPNNPVPPVPEVLMAARRK